HGAPPSGRVERSSALPNLREPRTASSPAANVVDERRRMLVAAFMMGVAAAVALYFSTSPRVTLEDAINGAGAAVVVTNPNNNSLFGMDDIGRDSTLDESKLDFGEGRDHGFAG
ncbi:MAG: hypothetical protein ACREQD_09655, partial [Candidatus Binataceae bacterium]